MPSSIAHSVSGYVVSQFFPPEERTSQWSKRRLIQILYVVFVANAPDLDFVPQVLMGERYHHGLTHSLTFAIGFTVLTWMACYFLANRLSKRLFLLTLILYSSHLFLDSFTAGGEGIQLLWPFTDRHFKSPIAIFPRVPWDTPLFHFDHFLFISFELGYSVALLGLLRLLKNRKGKETQGLV